VTIAEPFYMGVCTVTQEQYGAVMGSNPSRFRAPANPTENVSWLDAADFCSALARRGAGGIRLPTEAEWEYACRAGTRTRFSFGDDESDLHRFAWYLGNSDGRTHSVGTKQPNAWGLHDMHGGVYEWCMDWYGPYAGDDEENPTGPDAGSARAVRGGCWFHDQDRCRAAFRHGTAPSYVYEIIGFRVVLPSPADRG
jgi:formylglycine-generating enzyme required for sulfatase activity